MNSTFSRIDQFCLIRSFDGDPLAWKRKGMRSVYALEGSGLRDLDLKRTGMMLRGMVLPGTQAGRGLHEHEKKDIFCRR